MVVGGICGSANGILRNCANTGYIRGLCIRTGGIVGDYYSVAPADTLKYLKNSGTIIASSPSPESSAGGIFGALS